MGTVDGLTAARMQEIINAQMASAAVVGNDLVITKNDGSTVDAGNVRGAPGAGVDPRVAAYAQTTLHSLTYTSGLPSYDILMDTALFTPVGSFSLSTGKIVIPTAGLYHVDGLVELTGALPTRAYLGISLLASNPFRIVDGQSGDVTKDPATSWPTMNGQISGVVQAAASCQLNLRMFYTFACNVAHSELSVHRVG